MGPNPGINTVTASVTGIQEQQTFNAEGIRTPKKIEIISGDGQQGLPGAVLENPFVVEVRDQNDKPLAEVQVTFAVTSSEGTLSVTSTMTDSSGRAESTLTLGPGPETNTVEVSAAGIEGTVIFSAEIRRNEFDLSVPIGISLIHLPLRVTEVDGVPLTIESISDLYNTLGGADRVNVLPMLK